MRIIFMGTPEFAVPSLKMLIEEGYEVIAVVTQPDKPKGRGNKLTPPPVKECAQKYGIKVLQPEKVKTPEFADEIAQMKPDLIVTVAYGRILPKTVLDIPPFGCINVHGSLLPKYRGAAPMQWALINGEKVTGITTMYMDVGMDTGDMLLKNELEITPDMTLEELHDSLSELGALTLRETLVKLKNGTLERTPQNNKDATYAPMIEKQIGQIDWSKGAQEINNLIRGTNPWPGAYTTYKGERMRVRKAQPLDEACSQAIPGTILNVGKEGIIVATGCGKLRIQELQFDSSRSMSVESYLNGHSIDEGEILG